MDLEKMKNRLSWVRRIPARCTTLAIACLGKLMVGGMVQTEKVNCVTPVTFFRNPPGHDAYVEGSEKSS